VPITRALRTPARGISPPHQSRIVIAGLDAAIQAIRRRRRATARLVRLPIRPAASGTASTTGAAHPARLADSLFHAAAPLMRIASLACSHTGPCLLRNRRRRNKPAGAELDEQRHEHLEEGEDRLLYRALEPPARTPRGHRRTHLFQRVPEVGCGRGGISHGGLLLLTTGLI
jgi:hypothetical protein